MLAGCRKPQGWLNYGKFDEWIEPHGCAFFVLKNIHPWQLGWNSAKKSHHKTKNIYIFVFYKPIYNMIMYIYMIFYVVYGTQLHSAIIMCLINDSSILIAYLCPMTQAFCGVSCVCTTLKGIWATASHASYTTPIMHLGRQWVAGSLILKMGGILYLFLLFVLIGNH